MPNIPEYNLPEQASVMRPNEAASEAFERTGRSDMEFARQGGEALRQGFDAVGRAVAGIGEFYQRQQTQQQMMATIHGASALETKAATELPGILNSAKDPVAAFKNYMDSVVTPAQDALMQEATMPEARMWATEHLANLTNNMNHQYIAEAMHVAGAHAVATADATVQNYMTSAYQNPFGVQGYAAQIGHAYDGIMKTLTPEEAAALPEHVKQLQEQAYRAAGQALIQKNPAQFEADLKAGWGKGYLSAPSIVELSRSAQYQVMTNHAQAREAVEDHMDHYYDRLADPNVQANPKEIAAIVGQAKNDPALNGPGGGAARLRLQTMGVDMSTRALTGTNVPHDEMAVNLLSRDANNPNITGAQFADSVTTEVKEGRISAQMGLTLQRIHSDATSTDAVRRQMATDREGAFKDIDTATQSGFGMVSFNKEPAVQLANQGKQALLTYEQSLQARGVPLQQAYDPQSANYWQKQPAFIRLMQQAAGGVPGPGGIPGLPPLPAAGGSGGDITLPPLTIQKGQ